MLPHISSSAGAFANDNRRVDAPMFGIGGVGDGQLWMFRTCAAVYEQKRECNASRRSLKKIGEAWLLVACQRPGLPTARL